jgi:1-acyl-sn-glycerol-3-phosphate acyltransferase
MQPDWLYALWYELNFWTVYPGYLLGFSLRTEGSRHVPRSGPVLIIANHESYLDPVAVGLAVRRRIHYLARKTLFKGLLGSFLHSVGCVPVDQEGVAKEGIKTSLGLLKAGRALLVFPEGERTLSGHMLPFKPGISLLIKRAEVPIVPVGIAGAYESYPRSRLLPSPSPLFWPATGGALAVSVGKPILPARLVGLSREQVLDLLFQEVKTVVDRAERLRRKA